VERLFCVSFFSSRKLKKHILHERRVAFDPRMLEILEVITCARVVPVYICADNSGFRIRVFGSGTVLSRLEGQMAEPPRCGEGVKDGIACTASSLQFGTATLLLLSSLHLVKGP